MAVQGQRQMENAKRAKADEFYTQMHDIAAELRHYREQFRGKVVFCNCDDPYESNFFKYFALNFNFLELKKLIATCYIGSPIANVQLSLFDDEPPEDKTTKAPHKIEICEVEDYNADGAIDLSDVEFLLANKKNALTRLDGDGDFRSPECIALMQEADIIVTNPPFSLFREFVVTAMEHGKQILILGSQNAITYKEIFQFIKENRLWLGYDNGGTKWFRVPDDYEIQTASRIKTVDGIKYFSMGSIFWYTNLDVAKRHEFTTLYKRYSPEEYPHYCNYDAIEVSRYADMPHDYDGLMGVPITFVDKYNPEQFEIIGLSSTLVEWMPKDIPKNLQGGPRFYIQNADGSYQRLYERAVIRRKGTAQ